MTDAGVQRRLAELAHAHDLDGAALWKLAALIDVVARDDEAPTPIREPAQAIDVHVADSLSALEIDAVSHARRGADIGAGPGFPGLALAAALPHARITVVESVGRKAAFLRRAIAVAGLDNATVVDQRVELWEAGRERCDLVTARALAPLAVVVEYASPLLIDGGRLVAWKGRRDAEEEAAGEAAAGYVGLAQGEIRRVDPFPGAGERHLHTFTKVAPTPAGYPRRPGMARKRPLAGPRPAASGSQSA